MSASQRSVDPIVRVGVRQGTLPVESVRSNPKLTKQTHFSNFAGGYLVGVSTAVHPKGEECGLHSHRGAHEFFYVVAGCGTIQVGDELYHVETGDSVLVPAGTEHNLTGTSSDTEMFTVLCGFVVAPGHEEDEMPWRS